MSEIPTHYSWLAGLDPKPLMICHALAEYGVIEGAGTADNPVILGWAREVGLATSYGGDAIPWCGLFMAVVAQRASKAIPAKPLWALNWRGFGIGAERPVLGDVLVFRRNGGGHVGLYVGEDDRAYHVLGGNQSDRVCFTRVVKARLHAARRPVYRSMPVTARPYVLAPAGGLSPNEA
jgi:uncharacterized protein (TIGR02594 family)